MQKTFIQRTTLSAAAVLGGLSLLASTWPNSVVQTVSAAPSAKADEITSSFISVNGHVFAPKVPTMKQGGVSYLPLQALSQALEASGLTVTSDGTSMLIDNLAGQSSAVLLPMKKNQINLVEGAFDDPNVPCIHVKIKGKSETMIPVAALVKVLTQGKSGYFPTWRPGHLSLTNGTMGQPSTNDIEQVMTSTKEAGDPSEHFSLTGKPVTITVGNGDSVTACIGTRSPSADGYGQVVFFFHNQQFIGIDSPVEKSQIQSLKPSATGVSFDITYANYAKDDPMVNPSLPPATLSFDWDGNNFVPSGQSKIPSGTLNGIRVEAAKLPTATAITATSTTTVTSSSPFALDAVPTAVQNLFTTSLKSKGTLVNLPGQKSPYLPVDLNGTGQTTYVAAYQSTHGNVGLMVVGLSMTHGWQVVYQTLTTGTKVQELNAGPMTGDTSNEIALQTYVGDGANDVYILKEISGKVKPVLHVTGAADIGDFNGLGQMEVATWQHDTGPMENIQMYAWNPAKNAYTPAQNGDFPNYFGAFKWNYNQQVLTSHGQSNLQTSKMADAMWAQTYLNMGVYTKAIAVAKAGLHLKHAAVAYPPNHLLRDILKEGTIRESEVLAYRHLPSKVKAHINHVMVLHSGFYDALARAVPLVSKNPDGSYSVSDIGDFNQMRGHVYETGTELTFKVSQSGLTDGPVVMRNPFGEAVHEQFETKP